METGLFLILSALAVYLFMRLGDKRESGEFRSSDIGHAFRKRKK